MSCMYLELHLFYCDKIRYGHNHMMIYHRVSFFWLLRHGSVWLVVFQSDLSLKMSLTVYADLFICSWLLRLSQQSTFDVFYLSCRHEIIKLLMTFRVIWFILMGSLCAHCSPSFLISPKIFLYHFCWTSSPQSAHSETFCKLNLFGP